MNYIFIANGFEEIEAITIIDILRRGNIHIKTVSITESKNVIGAHNIEIITDLTLEDLKNSQDSIESITLPGGMPGTTNLDNCEELKLIIEKNKKTALINAICAAPMILGNMGLLDGIKATCFPGFEDYLKGAILCDDKVVSHMNIITGKGAGCAIDFALEILKNLKDSNSAKEIRSSLQL